MRARLAERHLDGGGVISCPAELVPAPGQYLSGMADGGSVVLPTTIFPSRAAREGFVAAPPLPAEWKPGAELLLRGPLGRGFALPQQARRVALFAYDGHCGRLASLIEPSIRQGAEIVMLTDDGGRDLPAAVEIQPAAAMAEVLDWADYLAIDVRRESLEALLVAVRTGRRGATIAEALVSTPMPCAGLAECGVCATSMRSGWRLACVEGPVFSLNELA